MSMNEVLTKKKKKKASISLQNKFGVHSKINKLLRVDFLKSSFNQIK